MKKGRESAYRQKPKSRKQGPQRNKKEEGAPSAATAIRLNRFLSNAGVCSRREADSLIEKGHISVNGKVITALGTKVMPGDKVSYKGKEVNAEQKVYILLNKPKDHLTTMDDPQGRRTVMDLLRSHRTGRVYPVGRLDRNTTGVLLFTNDGEMAKKLTHPSHRVTKMYHVHLNKALTIKDMQVISEGIDLEDGAITPDAIAYVDEKDKRQVGIELHSGRNRIVRRIFETLDYRVEKLDRVVFAGLTKKGLSRGKWRYLKEIEISRFKMGKFS